MRTFLLILACWVLPQAVSAQKEKREKKDPYTSNALWEPVPIRRQLAHDKIDKVQRAADEFDGKIDGEIRLEGREEGTQLVSNAIINQVDRLQIVIENLPLDHFVKLRYLGLLETVIKNITYDLANKTVEPELYRDIVSNYEMIFRKQQDGADIAEDIKANFSRSFDVLRPMFKTDTPAISAVFTGMVKLYPEEMFQRLPEIASFPAAEDLMAYLAGRKPNLILTYATSTAIERSIVRRTKDPLVRKIVEIADKANVPLRAIVYLDDLMSGDISMLQVNQITAIPESYYKSLVKQRLKPGTLTRRILERESKLQALEYVRTMNELHDSPDPVRFKCIENLSPEEMYFLMVLCSDEIYTSTFVGTFNRMLVKMAPRKGDVFLDELKMDKFRTFIRMCAGYNKLDEFIATIEPQNRNTLMARFVNNIDKNTETDLEDAVDVADSFGSINDPTVLEYLLGEVKSNYERTYLENNKRGLIIYFLLHTLCSSVLNPEESSDHLQERLKVPPITMVNYKNLQNEDGTVVEQVFFYGDEDGKNSYSSFLTNFKPEEWSMVKNDKWIKFTSSKGKPFTIYANLPLDEPQDEEAQKSLCTFLDQSNIKPAIIVHRGHSYHLSTTMEHLTPSNKIIILGSCGGYHNLSTILGHSDDAHIISSKQTGSMRITDPILRDVHQLVLNGRDINWIDLWNGLLPSMNTPQLQDLFNDYVPPHKNMGALFIKAFKIQMQENGLASNKKDGMAN